MACTTVACTTALLLWTRCAFCSPESNDCQDKDNCFHTCHRTCGDVCVIHHHYEPAASCEAPPTPDIIPNITVTGEHSKAVAEAEYGEKMNTIKTVLRGKPLPQKKIPLSLQAL